MAIKRSRIINNYTLIPNEIINNPKIGYKELGLLVYLLSKPETWEIMPECLAKEKGMTVGTIYRYLKTIRECGYATYQRNFDGTTDWVISNEKIIDEPQIENHKSKKPVCEKPQVENDNVLVIKELEVIKELNNNKRISNKKNEKTLSGYLDECRELGNKPIPEDDPIFDYARKVNIPEEYLGLGWIEFKRLQKQDKTQKDWKAVFRDYVRREFLKIWYFDRDGGCRLTAKGIQLQRELS